MGNNIALPSESLLIRTGVLHSRQPAFSLLVLGMLFPGFHAAHSGRRGWLYGERLPGDEHRTCLHGRPGHASVRDLSQHSFIFVLWQFPRVNTVPRLACGRIFEHL